MFCINYYHQKIPLIQTTHNVTYYSLTYVYRNIFFVCLPGSSTHSYKQHEFIHSVFSGLFILFCFLFSYFMFSSQCTCTQDALQNDRTSKMCFSMTIKLGSFFFFPSLLCVLFLVRFPVWLGWAAYGMKRKCNTN